MVYLQYSVNKIVWQHCGQFRSELAAWASLGGDNMDYRVVDTNGKLLSHSKENTRNV